MQRLQSKIQYHSVLFKKEINGRGLDLLVYYVLKFFKLVIYIASVASQVLLENLDNFWETFSWYDTCNHSLFFFFLKNDHKSFQLFFNSPTPIFLIVLRNDVFMYRAFQEKKKTNRAKQMNYIYILVVTRFLPWKLLTNSILACTSIL